MCGTRRRRGLRNITVEHFSPGKKKRAAIAALFKLDCLSADPAAELVPVRCVSLAPRRGAEARTRVPSVPSAVVTKLVALREPATAVASRRAAPADTDERARWLLPAPSAESRCARLARDPEELRRLARGGTPARRSAARRGGGQAR